MTASPLAPPSEHYANHASCSAAPGMPSEEEIARVLAEALRQIRIPDEIWSQMVASFRKLEGEFPDYAEGFSGSTDAFRGARAILSLIRPAFEAKDAEIATFDAREEECLESMKVALENEEDAHRKLEAAEAKLAQAVEALRKAKAFHDRDSGLNGFTADYECLRLEIDEAVAANEPAASAAARGEATTLASGKEKP